MNSMTGFGKASKSFDDFDVDIELKSVNNKYLDINFNTPPYLNFLQEDMRKLIKTRLKRGRVDLFIRINQGVQRASEVDLDIDLAEKIYEKLELLRAKLNLKADISLRDLVAYPDILTFSYPDYDEDKLREGVLEVLDSAIQNIASMREKEGHNLRFDLESNLDKIKEEIDKLNDYKDSYLLNHMKELEKRVKDLIKDKKVDQDRMYLELAVLAEKCDINEEVTRMYSHIDQFRSSLEGEGIGRRLDFIVQEMNREVNTISSKSGSKEITNSVIDIKSYIEKIREQIQNIE
ncbi:MAG: YicC/YloC family endoribonuclease [Finegoldia sp.]|nr:YicC/YloC family endoribonuclease [Finegoldia sp.]